MFTRTLTVLAAAMFAVPVIHAGEGEGPGVRPDRPAGEHKPDLGERPEAGSLFAKFDHDSSGSVSKPEFGHGLRILMEKRMEGGGDRPRPPEGGGDRPPRPPEGGGDRPPRPPEGGGDRPPRPPEGGGDRPPRPPEGGGDRPPRPPEGGGDRPPRPPEGGGNRPPRPPEGGEKENMMRERAEKAFKAGDANNDGVLSQEEFRAAMGALGGGQPPNKPVK